MPEFQPFFYEAQVGDLHLVLDFEAVDVLERTTGKSVDAAIGDMTRSVAAMAKVMWAVTRAHHADLSLPQVVGILLPGLGGDEGRAQAVAATLGDLVRRAFNVNPQVAEAPKPARKAKRRG